MRTVWAVMQGYDLDLMGIRSTRRKARELFDELLRAASSSGIPSNKIVIAEEWAVDGRPTGNKFRSKEADE